MFVTLLAAGIAAQPIAIETGYELLVVGDPGAAITALEAKARGRDDPAQLINLGIAYAQSGDRQRAKASFTRAYEARDWVELETATGSWVDSRTLARRALAMLERGHLARSGQFASK